MGNIKITKKMIDGISKMGDEALINWFMGVMFLLKKMHRKDRTFQNYYNEAREYTKKCREYEKRKETDTPEYKYFLQRAEKSIKNLMAYINYKRMGRK